jgi:hypothetical protein
MAIRDSPTAFAKEIRISNQAVEYEAQRVGRLRDQQR